MKTLIVSIVSAAALATAGMAAASTSTVAYDQQTGDQQTGSSGVYMSGGLGVGTQNWQKSDFATIPSKLSTVGLAWDANLGYQFNRYFAVEGGYISFGNTDVTIGGRKPTISEAGFDINAKGILPVSPKFDVFAKAGAIDLKRTLSDTNGTFTASNSETHWTPDLGLGLAYNVNHNIALTAQDVYAFKAASTIKSANAVLAGVAYKFSV